MKQRSFWKNVLCAALAMVLVPLLYSLMAAAPATAATPKHYTDLSFAPLPEVNIPRYERFRLPNGLIVYLMEDHELPLVSGTALIQFGERVEPATQVGLADLTAETMRTGGTLKHSADIVNQMLEQRAAAIELGVNDAMASANFNALSEDLEEVFGLFTEVLREPAFAPDKLDLAKRQHQGSIERRNDAPDSIGNREFKKLIYGADSPYARTKEYQTLNAITQTDVQAFYQRYVQPNRMILGIVGDFNPAKLRQLIESRFGDWSPSASAPSDSLPAVTQAKKGGVYIVDQPQLTQSSIWIGQLGGKANDPDVFALYVMNEALNSFGGRLFDEVRSRQGLAYSVYAVWSPRYDYPGIFIAGGQTRSNATVPFIKAVRTELSKVQQAPLTKPELDFAKESILNSFVFNFVEPSQTLLRLMQYEYFNYPKDFLTQYQQAVRSMTAQKVLEAAQRTLKSSEMVVLVVGNRQAIQPALETLNQKVTPIDITIPKAA